MSLYNIILVVLGVSILGVAWLPSLLKKYALSYPIFFVGLGLGLFSLPLGLPDPDPVEFSSFAIHLTEICVTVALTGTGLKIDRRFSLKAWRIPLVLVLGLMLVTIGSFVGLAWGVFGLPLAAAVLLAATLAPTDPVLAGDVQVGEPGEGREDNVRFALTGEAGLNDGLAFPFVYLALALLPIAQESLGQRLWHWAWMDVGYRTALGVLGGWLAGRGLSYLIFDLPHRIRIKPSAYGFVALAVTLTAYGLTELVHGYGFLAVFVAATTLRRHERSHEYQNEMHDFTDQLERLLIVVILILFGGAIAWGLFDHLSWTGVALGLLLVLVLRPLGGMLTLAGSQLAWQERLVISFFGIRGIGSFFYLAFALDARHFADGRGLWATTGFTVLLSIILHGVLATPVMNWLDRQQGRPTAEEEDEQEQGEEPETEASAERSA
ncbi:cation:proton antiporter [Hymenobacter rubripertinctus]|uniref:Sodium:proton antiporter n=1 Tax=Hymenobacter rubripertinctus TaxID=2029981 RepID=A0A418R0E1_9BACT|nr:cation:proton antiporter [Hymenobacter rubripertinctus]RIY10838.1 sodium:proton antiporter [Hymenobacter rubripertinctus]